MLLENCETSMAGGRNVGVFEGDLEAQCRLIEL
jgi:hypothetical protein